ncbi:hypothetical protein ALO83_104048 [Pseudomonas cannabina pv. alisalensis]|uniref:Uncharacterized protein n=1 Tax=Pseudomonas cannabina TaxID=86840 RepID=A0A3M3QMF4_PSECA|nr:Uncharacterized protein AC507_4059 [Pseudomonas syringae pv. maculicola]KPW26027.1 hypothetical protein ALO83_104048 [Pseudomonas cannabina pv. alisalensis]RMN85418.1 hypothetical protein ALQ53_103776 [Pseudomonas cannabina]RMN86666.1 hypothetical protein ALQ52_104779 [Pseudomonas cannabina pv. alisalensis]RMO01790.1 hypothetical protein ALQ51_102364 [Pseudomonas cannabina]
MSDASLATADLRQVRRFRGIVNPEDWKQLAQLAQLNLR